MKRDAVSRLVFVASELSSRATGDAGRALRDMLRSMSEADLARTTLLVVDAAIDDDKFKSQFPQVNLVLVDAFNEAQHSKRFWRHPPSSAYSDTPWHARSAALYRALQRLSEAGGIDYVEFPDRGGLGFCTLQQMRLTGFLAEATVAIRLCASNTAVLCAEARSVGIQDLHVSDLERKCLRDCDIVLAASAAIGETTRGIFGIANEEWEPRVVLHRPPLSWRGLPVRTHAVDASLEQAIVFASAPERMHRPDLFVRSVSAFMRSHPDHSGPALWEGAGAEPAYVMQVKSLVPVELVPRFERMQWDQRRFVNATVIVASEYDALCIRALEASRAGARLILNGANPAYGDDSPWKDGVNCLKFDGTVAGLSAALERNLGQNESLRVVYVADSPWPWLTPRRSRSPRHAASRAALVSVVIAHHNLGAYLPQTLDSVFRQTWPNVEILVVDDASTAAPSQRLIDMLAGGSDPRVKVLRLDANVGLAAARNHGIRHCSGRYVLTLDADDLVHSRLLELGVTALENNPDFDVVVTPAGYFPDGAEMSADNEPVAISDYAIFTGEAVLGGLMENRFSTATAFFRKSVLNRFPYIESLGCYEDWSLYMRMCDEGIRFIVTTEALFFYRRRSDSMVHTPRDAARKRIEYSDLIRTSAPRGLKEKARHLSVGIGSPVAVPNVATTEPGPVRGRDALTAALELRLTASPPSPPDAPRRDEWCSELPPDLFGRSGRYDEQVVFASLKMSRWMERRMPRLVGAGIAAARRFWRAYRALRSLGSKERRQH